MKKKNLKFYTQETLIYLDKQQYAYCVRFHEIFINDKKLG